MTLPSHPVPKARGFSMRASLVAGFGSVLLLTAAGIVFNNLYAGHKVVRSLSRSILDQATALVEVKLEVFFGVVSGVSGSTAQRLENGSLGWRDWDGFRRFLLPMLQRLPQVCGVGAGDSEGNAYNLTRRGTSWWSQEVQPAAWGTNTLWKEWTAEGDLVREWWEASEFDPRRRPWFTNAVAVARLGSPSEGRGPLSPHWTLPYRFFTTGARGVTVATRVPWGQNLDAVVYFDVALSDLDAFMDKVRPSTNGLAIVLTDDLEVLGWPGRAGLPTGKLVDGGVEAFASQAPLLAASLEHWREQGQPDTLVQRVRGPDQNLWMAFRSLPVAGEKLHVLVSVPEEDFLGESRRERQRMVMVLVVSLVVAVALAVWLASIYTRPIALLVDRSEAIQRLELSGQAEVASRVKEVQQLAGAQARMSAALESFGRYVPRDVIRELLRQGEAAKIGAHPAELTVLFSDIRSFTQISEMLPPDDVARYLSDYFDVLHGILVRHGGTTDKFIGDAIMAFWGAPRPDANHALNAVRAVLEGRDRLESLNRVWKAKGRPEFHTTFGLASGPVVVGNVGARDRLNYTVLGNTVNVASRCVGLGRQLGCSILALESVATACSGEIEWRRLGPVSIRGIRQPRMVCEPLGVVGEVAADVLAFREDYERALDAYLGKDLGRALELLERLTADRPGQPSVLYLLQRCRELRQGVGGEIHTEMLSFQ